MSYFRFPNEACKPTGTGNKNGTCYILNVCQERGWAGAITIEGSHVIFSILGHFYICHSLMMAPNVTLHIKTSLLNFHPSSFALFNTCLGQDQG
jgi:hypothetical protein